MSSELPAIMIKNERCRVYRLNAQGDQCYRLEGHGGDHMFPEDEEERAEANDVWSKPIPPMAPWNRLSLTEAQWLSDEQRNQLLSRLIDSYAGARAETGRLVDQLDMGTGQMSGQAVILGAQPKVATLETATGAELDELAYMIDFYLRRKPGEPDAELRDRAREMWNARLQHQRGFGTPAIHVAPREYPLSGAGPYAASHEPNGTIEDALIEAMSHGEIDVPVNIIQPTCVEDERADAAAVCSGQLGCGTCSGCRRYKGEP